MVILDYVIVFFFAIGVPILSYKSYPMIKAELEKGDRLFRQQLYRSVTIQQWVIVAVVLLIYGANERSWQALGFNPIQESPATLLGFAVLAVYAAFSLFVLHKSQTNAVWDARLRRWLDNTPGVEVGPTTQPEMRQFTVVSLTAGVCEEIIYRGYLIWFFAQMSNVWVALIISSVLFGLNHFYQGYRGMLRTGLVGLVLGGFYVSTGSLLLPILMHAMIDFYSGKMILHVNQKK